jgi:hypothetical protein
MGVKRSRKGTAHQSDQPATVPVLEIREAAYNNPQQTEAIKYSTLLT